MLADVGLEIGRVTAALDGVYPAAVVNNILEREKRKGRRTITDPIRFRKIIMFPADNIGGNADGHFLNISSFTLGAARYIAAADAALGGYFALRFGRLARQSVALADDLRFPVVETQANVFAHVVACFQEA